MKILRRSVFAAFVVMLAVAMSVFAAACHHNDDPPADTTVGYSVEVWLEGEDGFAKSDEHSYSDSGNVGEEVTVTPVVIENYVYDSANSENVTTLTLSEDESLNLFKLYYKVNSGTVTPPEPVLSLSYNANAPRGNTASGSVADSEVAENGTATVAENGYTISGYRFAGWSTVPTGVAQYQPGDTITVTGATVLYAVWDAGYSDRYGSADIVFVLSNKSGAVVLQRGSVEFEGTIDGDNLFTVEVSANAVYNGKVYGDYTFAYKNEELAGSYLFHSSYYNPDDPAGVSPVQADDTLEIDVYGEGVHSYNHAETGAPMSDVGFVSYFAETDEYLFYITEGDNAGNGFLFKTSTVNGTPVFSTTFGEYGLYQLATTPDGSLYFLGGNALVLDGYGNITYSDYYIIGDFTGYYWIEGVYGDGVSIFIYKVHARIKDDANRNLLFRGYNVVNGYAYLDFYTMPLSADYVVYVEPHFEAGEYQNEDGSTLSLDGFKVFADSATYVDSNGVSHTGAYEVSMTQRDGLIVTLLESNGQGGEDDVIRYEFLLPLTNNSVNGKFSVFKRYDTAVEYILLDSNLNYSLVLMVYEDEYEGVKNAVKGEILVNEGTSNNPNYVVAASGYITTEVLRGGEVSMFTFVCTNFAAGADTGFVPKGITFMVSTAYDSNYIQRNIYYVYEYVYEGATSSDADDIVSAQYSEIYDTEEGSNRKIVYLALASTQSPIGSLYYDESGNVHEGALAISAQGDYFFGIVGEYTFKDFSNTLYFDILLDADGNPVRFTDLVELEYPAFEMSYTGRLVTMVSLLIRGNEALYSEDGDFNNESKIERCTIEIVGVTDFDEYIYALVNAQGIEVFRMVMDIYAYYDMLYGYMDIWIYYLYNENLDNSFTVNDAGTNYTLRLDGFHYGSYTDASGNTVYGDYYLSDDGNVVYFNPERGVQMMCLIEGGKATLLDGIYGRYTFYVYDLHQWCYLSFDGLGTVTATAYANAGGGRLGSGFYEVLHESGFIEAHIYLSFNGIGMKEFTVSFNVIRDEENGLVLYESFELYEDMRATFHNSDGDVLTLDGYREGVLTRARGGRGLHVIFEVISREGAYITVTDENGSTYNIFLNYETHTFSYPESVSTALYYYNDSFGSLVIDRNGDIVLNGNWGFYSIIGDKMRVFFQDAEDYMLYHVYEWDIPGGNVYTIEDEVYGGTYYRSTGNQNVTLTGTVLIEYGEVSEEVEATLTFTMPRANGDRFEVSAVFTVNNEVYNVNIISYYFDYETSSFRGLAFVDYLTYTYSPLTSYAYNGNGRGTFLIEIKAKTVTMHDAYDTEETDGERNPEDERGSTLTEYSVAFGPLEFGGSYLSGNVNVGNGEWLVFEDALIEKVYQYGTDRGVRYMAIFEYNGTKYSIQYYKFAGDYGLYMVATYDEVVDYENGYTVGINKYYYSNVAYSMPEGLARGDFANVVLFEGTDENRTAIVAYNALVNGDKQSAWLVALGTYDESTGAGQLGSIYSIEFADATLSAVTVKEYSFKQGQGFTRVGDGSIKYFANFYLDEDGEVVAPAALAFDYGAGSYDFLIYTSVEKSVEKENTWIFRGSEEGDFYLTILTDENGYMDYDGTGEYWYLEVGVYEG